MGSNWVCSRRCWCGAPGIVTLFWFMLPLSHGQSSLYALMQIKVSLRLLIVRSYSSCLGKVQQSNCLKENFPLVIMFLSAAFLAFNLACSAFTDVKSMEEELFIKLTPHLSVENPSYPHYNTLSRHIWNQVKLFKYFGNIGPYGMMVIN